MDWFVCARCELSQQAEAGSDCADCGGTLVPFRVPVSAAAEAQPTRRYMVGFYDSVPGRGAPSRPVDEALDLVGVVPRFGEGS